MSSTGPPPIPIAVIGLGSAGIRHAKNFADLGCEIIGADRETDRLQMLDRVPGARGATTTDAIDDAGAVVIATPADSHLEIAGAAARAGKHILVEKPLSTSLEGVDALKAASRQVVAMMAFNLRFLPSVRKASALIADGAIGVVLSGSFEFGYDLRKWNPGRDYRSTYSAHAAQGGGVLLDAIHELDLLLTIAGQAESVIGSLAHTSSLEIDAEDTVSAVVTTRSGAMIGVSLDYVSPVYHRGFRLIGDEGMIAWDWSTGILDFVRDEARAQFQWTTNVDDTYVAEASHFLECIGTGLQPDADLDAGIAALELAVAIRESARLEARAYIGEQPDE